MVKLAVIVGHTKKAPGATSFKGESEYVFNNRIANYMVNYARKNLADSIEVMVFYRDKAGVAGAAKEAKAWGATHCIELHFNAAGRVAYGSEVLILKGDSVAAKHADLLTDRLNTRYGIKERRITQILQDPMDGDGVYETVSGNNGYGNLAAVKAAGIPHPVLIEPCFMDTKNSESQKIYADEEGYAKLMVDYYVGLQVTEYNVSTNKVIAEPYGTFDDFIRLLRAWNFENYLNNVKVAILSQAMLESGRGTSQLFLRHKNSMGLKWRKEAAVEGSRGVNYKAHDGGDLYAEFDSFGAHFNYLKKFFARSVYNGVEKAATSGNIEFIRHLKACGYAQDPSYVAKVTSLFAEAEQALKNTPEIITVDPDEIETPESFNKWKPWIEAVVNFFVKLFGGGK